MKLALITLDYPPETGGVAKYLEQLVRASHGQIDVFVNLTHSTCGTGRVEAMHLLMKGFWKWRPAISSIRSLKSRGYQEVLISHLLPLGTAALLARFSGGLPYSLFIHGLDLRLAIAHPRKRKIAQIIIRKARHVFANSEKIASEIEQVSGVKAIVLRPGTNIKKTMGRIEARRKLDIEKDASIILAVGRLIPRKGFDRLIESLAFLSKSRQIVILGDGNDKNRLEEIAKPFKDQVRFISSATDEMRDIWYCASDLFALPVRDEGTDVEGFGIVYLEAAAHALPVIAGRSGGAVEAIEDKKTGLLVNPHNPQDIAEKIEYLFMHKDRREEMGRAGQARIRTDFSLEDRIDLLKKTLETLTKKFPLLFPYSIMKKNFLLVWSLCNSKR